MCLEAQQRPGSYIACQKALAISPRVIWASEYYHTHTHTQYGQLSTQKSLDRRALWSKSDCLSHVQRKGLWVIYRAEFKVDANACQYSGLWISARSVVNVMMCLGLFTILTSKCLFLFIYLFYLWCPLQRGFMSHSASPLGAEQVGVYISPCKS